MGETELPERFSHHEIARLLGREKTHFTDGRNYTEGLGQYTVLPAIEMLARLVPFIENLPDYGVVQLALNIISGEDSWISAEESARILEVDHRLVRHVFGLTRLTIDHSPYLKSSVRAEVRRTTYLWRELITVYDLCLLFGPRNLSTSANRWPKYLQGLREAMDWSAKQPMLRAEEALEVFASLLPPALKSEATAIAASLLAKTDRLIEPTEAKEIVGPTYEERLRAGELDDLSLRLKGRTLRLLESRVLQLKP